MDLVICIGKLFTRQNIKQKRIRFSFVLAFIVSAFIIFVGFRLFMEMKNIPEIKVRYDDK